MEHDLDLFEPFFSSESRSSGLGLYISRELCERYGAQNPRSWMCRFHTQTAGCSLTAQQPVNNVVRTAVQALAAILGGTQSLHTNALDETLALPTEENARALPIGKVPTAEW